MEKDIQDKIGQIQLIQQNLQNFSMQRQQFQIQDGEIDSALKEIETARVSYKIIGNIMVLTDRDALKADLLEKKQMLEIRIKSIEKQEGKLREKAEELQKEILSGLENKNSKKSDPKSHK